jgi:hypothetical protein
VESGLDKGPQGSSYRGLTIESAHQRKTGVDGIGPHLRRTHKVYYY